MWNTPWRYSSADPAVSCSQWPWRGRWWGAGEKKELPVSALLLSADRETHSFWMTSGEALWSLCKLGEEADVV